MVKQRRVAVITAAGAVVCAERAVPEPRDHEVLVRVRCSLISPGSETDLVRTRRAAPAAAEDDWEFGYSCAGDIAAIRGEAPGLKVGMRVACMCGEHADWNWVPVNLAVPIPDGVSYEEAAFTSLAATALQAVRRTEVALGEYGLVLGLGIVGNLAAQLYRLSGARVLAWEKLAGRRRTARRCGIGPVIDPARKDAAECSRRFAAPYGADFALLAFGGDADAAFRSLTRAMKVSADGHIMGRVVVVGGCT